MMAPKVSIIILNWNRSRDTVECIESVQKITYPNYDILIVDNGSTDESVKVFSQRFPNLQLLCLSENRYYAGGNNAGIRLALATEAKYIMLLNNDTVVDPNYLKPLVTAMEKDPTLAAVGGTLYFYEKPNIIQNTGGYINFITGRVHTRGVGENDIKQYCEPREVDFICGAAIMLRTETIKAVGLLDESYKLYAEEVDWCLKAKRKGFRSMFIPDSKILHKEAITTNTIQPLATYFMTRNKIWLVRRHANGKQVLLFHLIGFLYRYPKILLVKLIRRNFELILPTFRAIIDGYKVKPF